MVLSVQLTDEKITNHNKNNQRWPCQPLYHDVTLIFHSLYFNMYIVYI